MSERVRERRERETMKKVSGFERRCSKAQRKEMVDEKKGRTRGWEVGQCGLAKGVEKRIGRREMVC